MDKQQNIEDMEFLLYMDELELSAPAENELTQYSNEDKIKSEEN